MVCTIAEVQYRRDIDGLRAIAVGVVVAFHAFPTALPGGFVGVDVFFVISGFLITGILRRALDANQLSYRAFYARRIRRIVPALGVVVISSLIAGWFLLLPVRYASLGTHAVGAAGFVSNFVVWTETGYFATQAVEKPLLHLWSLGIEEQFYLAWPLALWLMSRARTRFVRPMLVVTVASFVLGVVLTRTAPDAAFYLPVARIWELSLGGVLACVRPAPVRGVPRGLLSGAGLAAIAFAAIAFDAGSPYPGWRALLPTLGACLVIVAGADAVPNRTLLGNPVVVAVGRISYPLYLWHWVLLTFGFLVVNVQPSASVRLALVGASILMAVATYALVERPIRAHAASSVQAISLALVLVAIAIAGRVIVGCDGVPSRFPRVARALLEYKYDYLADAHAGECWLAARDPATGFRESCFPSVRARPSMFVWGDSHAGRLRPGLERVYGATFAIGSATRDVCPPEVASEDARADGCSAGNRFVLSMLERSPPTIVVLFANWSETAIPSLPETCRRLLAAGVRHVVIVGPAPKWTTNLPTAIYEAWRTGSVTQPLPPRLSTNLVEGTVTLDREMKERRWSAGVAYVSLLELLCNADGCLTYVPGSTTDLMSYDYGHLTTPGATLVARGLALDALERRAP